MVLKEVHETELFKHISKFFSSMDYEDILTYSAAKACCQGAEILSGCSSKGFCCQETCVNCVKGMLLLVSFPLRKRSSLTGLEPEVKLLMFINLFSHSRFWRGRRNGGDWSCGA